MLGDQRPTAGQRAFVSGLLGSAGTGSTGLGVVDATPIGGLLSAQENAQRGDYKGTALAMLPIPGAKLGNAVQRAAEEAVPAIERGIVAYHGSPHSFDRFDMSKIGTGEGAQAYGHGLYFADKEDVAKQYREFLSSRNNDLTDPGNLAASLLYRTPEGTREAAVREARTVLNSIDRMPAAYKHDPGVKERTQKALELLQSGAELPKQGGSMYQVRINADPEHFLDYEKPLSEQSPVVQQLLQKIPAAPDRASWPHITGNDLHEQLRVDAMGDDAFMGSSGYRMQRRNEAAVDVAKSLREAGIPGIKYLDQGSRSAGEGSRNYVVFDDKLVEIMKKYGLVGLLGGGAAMNAAGQQQPEM